MKKHLFTLVVIAGVLLFAFSCRQNSTKSNPSLSSANTVDSTGLFLLGKDIVTEVILRPDTTGDPWEVEKVKNYNGTSMYKDLLNKIYSKELTAYDIISGKPLSAEYVKNLTNEFEGDMSKIGKLQFLEDWYYDPASNRIIKKLKSTSFAYEYKRQANLPVVYKALFKIKM